MPRARAVAGAGLSEKSDISFGSARISLVSPPNLYFLHAQTRRKRHAHLYA